MLYLKREKILFPNTGVLIQLFFISCKERIRAARHEDVNRRNMRLSKLKMSIKF